MHSSACFIASFIVASPAISQDHPLPSIDAQSAAVRSKYYYNCDSYRGKFGSVKEVSIGLDGNDRYALDFTFIQEGQTGEVHISVKDDIRHMQVQAQYMMLLAAQTSQARLWIGRCVDNEAIGLTLTSSAAG